MSISEYELVMKAAGDRTRARILKLLESGDLCVSDLRKVLSLGQSTVSQHLSILRKAGLVDVRREGRSSFYSLPAGKSNRYAPPMLALLLGWLEDDSGVRADRRRLARLRPARPTDGQHPGVLSGKNRKAR